MEIIAKRWGKQTKKEVAFFIYDLERGVYNTTKSEMLIQFNSHLYYSKEQSLGT